MKKFIKKITAVIAAAAIALAMLSSACALSIEHDEHRPQCPSIGQCRALIPLRLTL